ncbi:MAG: hypothetical protein HY053_05735 [Proteobacteria bacterium]|nr:hypothetical protein [Pseudomonadota bacterium]
MISEGGLITPSRDLVRQLENYRLTTAEILYRLPDHPSVLQTFLWQELDQIPGFPVLRKFLGYWQRELEGKLYRVRVAAVASMTPGEWRALSQEIRIH